MGVLQEIHIDDSIDMSTSPFADIHEFSQIPGELEILMAIGTVFEMESVKENVRITLAQANNEIARSSINEFHKLEVFFLFRMIISGK